MTRKEAVVTQNRQHPTCWRYVQDICNSCSFLLTVPQRFTISTQTCCVCWIEKLYLASGPLCIVWKETIYVLSGLIFFLLHQTPFPASSPGEKKGEYMILVRWSGLMLNWTHQLGQQLKSNWPERPSCCGWFLHQHPLCSIDLWWYEDYHSAELF